MKVGYNQLSVGYNNSIGQPFFDLLNGYKNYIHSYFFSVGENFFNQSMDIEQEIENFRYINTYAIHANLLFNNNLNMYFGDDELFKDIIDKLSEVVNLTDVTVVFPDMGRKIKKYFPNLKIHSSVRFFTWNQNGLDASRYPKMVEEWVGIADVINLDITRSLTDYDLQKHCKELGFGIKFIIWESCIQMNEDNYNTLPGFEDKSCHGGWCKHVCRDICKRYPWMELARSTIYKEMLDTIYCDIIKISSRNTTNLLAIKHCLDYYTSDRPTDSIKGVTIHGQNYQVFLDYINDILHCSHRCGECRKCEEYYNKLGIGWD